MYLQISFDKGIEVKDYKNRNKKVEIYSKWYTVIKGEIRMKITEVSERYGLSADTLRYYERVGLIPSVNRNKNGIRDYTEEDCRWVEFIKLIHILSQTKHNIKNRA